MRGTDNVLTDPSEQWRRSSHCASGACVEVRVLGADAGVLVRDSKQVGGPILAFDVDEWRSFLAGVRGAEFDA